MSVSPVRDVIAHPEWHPPSTVLARELAARLHLRPVDVPWLGPGVDAALGVAPVAVRAYRAPTTPVVVLTRAAAARGRRRPGVSIVCGLQDDDDAACVAIADALAGGLGLPLILVHVVPSVALAPLALAASSGMPAPITGRTVHDRAAARETVDRVACAAGVARPDTAGIRLTRGTPGPTLAATAKREGAALVVVSTSTRHRLQRALLGSATCYLLRRCERPVVVCPREPTAAMRLRAAITPLADPRTRPR